MAASPWILFGLLAVGTASSVVLRNNERPHMSQLGQKPNPEQRAFFSHMTCIDKCMLVCQAILAENQKTLYLCPQLKPPEKSLTDRFISEASWPWLLFLGVLGLSIAFCLLCMCYSCCCRTGRGRRSDHSSREPLSVDRRIEEIIGDHVDHNGHTHHCRGERISGSKYVVDV